MFAQRKVTLPQGRHKIIILDEADSMTAAAQQALRRTMEVFSSTTRFALACNTSSKLIEPIQSRCAILRYTRLSDEDVARRLLEVMRAESIGDYTEDGIGALVFTAQGDMRAALNNLQSTIAGQKRLTASAVYRIVDQPHPKTLQEIVALCDQAKLTEAIVQLGALFKTGYSAHDLIGTLFRVVRDADSMVERRKLAFLREISVTHARISEGINTSLQMHALLARLCDASIDIQ